MAISSSPSSKDSQSAEKSPQHCVDVASLTYIGAWCREEELSAMSAAIELKGGEHLSTLEYHILLKLADIAIILAEAENLVSSNNGQTHFGSISGLQSWLLEPVSRDSWSVFRARCA